ncbi:MAG TPA: CoA transferase [Tepidiformaceae bacterium]|nr:CoA transferase [Tepidiformaceae bacterium]
MKKLPLEGVRVLDLTMMWAGPFATKLLAEMGAEVIKIESPNAWDNIRTLIPQPGIEEPWNASYYFNDYNRDKKSLVLDLAHPRGREVFLQLVPHADVVIENYRADVLDNLNLSYEVLRQVREDIILVSMAGFGKTGSEKDQVGFGPIIEQMGGVASTTGYGDDGEPYKTGVSYGDPVGGIAAAGAVALALIHRKKTGKGTFVDLAQRETMATMIGQAFVASSLRGEEPVHRGNRSDRWAPQGIYPCAGDDQWIAVSVRDDDEWRALASVIGATDLEAFGQDERISRHDEIDERIRAWTRQQDPQAAMETLAAARVPAGRVLDSDAIHRDPHLLARGFWVELPHPRMAPWKQPSSAWRFVEANPQLRRHAPLFGEHTAEILGELLGMGSQDIAALDAEGVTSRAPVNPGVG